MKGFKKVLTGVLAGAMALAMAFSTGNATTVKAAGTGKITVSNTTQDETYDLYKVFDATYVTSGEGENQKTNVAYSYKGTNASFLASLKEEPKLVICDSQVFKKCAEVVPETVMLTSFSILLARYKGYLDSAMKGIQAIKSLEPEDRILIAEGCTHHRQCNDIGPVKIPGWLKSKLGFDVQFDTCSGTEFPEELGKYKAVIHCGGCMLNEREINYRVKCAEDQGVPVTNYGILIAYIQGILDRAVKVIYNK